MAEQRDTTIADELMKPDEMSVTDILGWLLNQSQNMSVVDPTILMSRISSGFFI